MNRANLESNPEIIKTADYYWNLYSELGEMWCGSMKFWLLISEPGNVSKNIPRVYTDLGDLVISATHWLFDINDDLRQQAFFGARITHPITASKV